MIQHPNKQQNILKMKDKRVRRLWMHRRMREEESHYKPVTSTTWRPGRRVTCSHAAWARGSLRCRHRLYISVPTRFVMARLFSWVKCPCDNCVRERENPRLRKERPAKDVEAAKLREFKRKKEADHG